MIEVRAAGFVIYRKIINIEYLLMQASYGDHHWTPPKGHVEAGESDLETAYRETEEEAGLKRTQLKVDPCFRKPLQYNAKGKQKESVYFLAELADSQAQVRLSHEHQAFKWAELTEACVLAKYPEMVDLLHECDKYLTPHP